MILDCYIIREYLPNGKHTDHGYYERQEMLDDAKQKSLQTGENLANRSWMGPAPSRSDFISMAGES